MDSQDVLLPNAMQGVVPNWSILFILADSDWLLRSFKLKLTVVHLSRNFKMERLYVYICAHLWSF